LWTNHEKAVAWASNTHLELSRQFRQVENLEERIAANRILNDPSEVQLKYEGRLLNSLRVLRKECHNGMTSTVTESSVQVGVSGRRTLQPLIRAIADGAPFNAGP
jgi:hypothetical protein